VSIVVAARNEADRLGARLRNLLALDYPADRRQVIVVSDGSTDDTAAILAAFGASVELVRCPPRGKASALNAGVARARHAIVVFADARQAFARDALQRLVRNFGDPSVGAVSGELVLDCEEERTRSAPSASSIRDGVGLYWRYEKWLRRRESLVGSTLGVTGAISAMRRSCWLPLPPRTILDDVLAPMRVVLAGKRVVFDGSARAFDETVPDARTESRRKIRTLAGNYQMLRLEPRLLVPLVNPVWLQFVSHKVGRLLVPYALIVCLVSSAALARQGFLYAAALAVQGAIALLAAYGAVLDRRARATASGRARGAAATVRRVDAEETRTKKVVNA
jgi:cellulose synthase/poly-beta-1,6-N-acetylglucosamine synthase-like glycosyltransferase